MTMTMTRQWRGNRNRIRNGNSKWHLHVPVIRPKGEQGTNLMNQHHHHQPSSHPAIQLRVGLSKCSIADIGEVAAATSAIRQMQLGFGDAFVSGILSMPHRHSFSGLRIPVAPSRGRMQQAQVEAQT